MSKVFFAVTMSLDGFIAPEERADDPEGEMWLSQWMRLQDWVGRQRFFLENLQLGDGGETGEDNEFLKDTFNRTGVSIMGKRMFDAGEHRWPDEAPFHSPVFVVTHEERQPWERPGGTTFHFVNDGIESALRQAREVGDGRDIRIAGGANTIMRFLNAGLVDEFAIALSPVFLGAGIRLFDGVDRETIKIDGFGARSTPLVTHLNYSVKPVISDS